MIICKFVISCGGKNKPYGRESLAILYEDDPYYNGYICLESTATLSSKL